MTNLLAEVREQKLALSQELARLTQVEALLADSPLSPAQSNGHEVIPSARRPMSEATKAKLRLAWKRRKAAAEAVTKSAKRR